jgi:hypothetical protein
MSLKCAGRTAMNALVAPPAKKMRPRARTKFPPGLFGLRHGGAEKKFNRTGGTAGKTLAGGLALRETATRIRYRRIESRAASVGRSHQAGGSNSRVEACFHDDLLYPDDLLVPLLAPIRILYVAEFGLLSVTFNRGTVD